MAKKKILEMFLLLLIIAGGTYFFALYQNQKNQETVSLRLQPDYASSYSISNETCSYQTQNCALLDFTFSPSEPAVHQTPAYDVNELPQQAETEITFHATTDAGVNFSYDEINSNPLLEDIETHAINNDFIITIHRKGALTPAEVTMSGPTISIKLPEDDTAYPKISDFSPADAASANPGLQNIAFKVSSSDQLQQAVASFQNNPVSLLIPPQNSATYQFSFPETITSGNHYTVLAVVTDKQNLSTAAVWSFDAQVDPAAVALPADRFQYLGWWGKINTDGVAVRISPDSQSTPAGTFSTINRIKVLKEVTGKNINGNSTWYQIDGGVYPGDYIFSAYVTPIAQPQPQPDPNIPAGAGPQDYWIDVNISKEILTLFQYDKPVFATYVSTGRSISPTILGTFRIWDKLTKTRMHGGPPVTDHFYDLPNVPYVMYYHDSFSVHGTYWHDKFGTPQSAGCTNVTQGDAKFIFDKVNPPLPAGTTAVLSSASNQGTIVYNHY